MSKGKSGLGLWSVRPFEDSEEVRRKIIEDVTRLVSAEAPTRITLVWGLHRAKPRKKRTP